MFDVKDKTPEALSIACLSCKKYILQANRFFGCCFAFHLLLFVICYVYFIGVNIVEV